jgi:hypothetical protein
VSRREAAGLQLRFRDEQHRYFQPPPGRPADVHVQAAAHTDAKSDVILDILDRAGSWASGAGWVV